MVLAVEEILWWGFTVILIVFIFWILGYLRVGSRRECALKACPPIQGSGTTEWSHEPGLMQQWYVDQPCQRLFGFSFSAHFSSHGVSLLANRGAVQTAVCLLVRRHPVLTSTIVRDPKTGKATVHVLNTDGNATESGPVQFPSLGPVPVQWRHRSNSNTWLDEAHHLNHTDMNEQSWLFRIVIVVNTSSDNVSQSNDDGYPVEVLCITHHLIADGLSSVNLLADFLQIIADTNDSGSSECAEVSYRYQPMDRSIDLTPRLGTVARAILADELPSLFQSRSHHQGPAVLPVRDRNGQPYACGDNPEAHVATFTLHPHDVRKLLTAAKARYCTLQGLLAAALAAAFQKSANSPDEENVKLAFPIGHSVRQLAKEPVESVGVFITSRDIDIPSADASYRNLWVMAKQLTREAKESVYSSLDLLGVLNFLPRESWTPWFCKQGKKYRLGRNCSVEMSNVGRTLAIDRLIQSSASVRGMLGLNEHTGMPKVPPKVHFFLGKNYMGPVCGVGVATCCDCMTVTVCSQLGQCGCLYPQEKNAFANQAEDAGLRSEICSCCPTDGLLVTVATEMLQILKTIVNDSNHDSGY